MANNGDEDSGEDEDWEDDEDFIDLGIGVSKKGIIQYPLIQITQAH